MMVTLAKILALILAVASLLLFVININQVEIILVTSVVVLRNLQSALQIVALIASGGLVVGGIGILATRIRQPNELGEILPDAYVADNAEDAQLLMKLVNSYLSRKDTTAFFKEKVAMLGMQVPSIQNRVDSVVSLVQQRFTHESLGYQQFIVPVRILFNNLVNLAIDLMRRLDKFDAVHYQRKIEEGGNSAVGVADYLEIMNTYKGLVVSVIDSLENATVKLDRLIIEIGAISSDDLVRSSASLRELDASIAAMKELETRIVQELVERI